MYFSSLCLYRNLPILECFMWFAWRQMLDCIIMFSAQDQLSILRSSIPIGEQNNSFGRQIIPEMGQGKSFGIQNISFGRQNKSFGIQNNSFGRQINPVTGALQIQTLGKVTENLLWETIFRYNVINSHNIGFNANLKIS